MGQPPNGYGVFLELHGEGAADIMLAGRKHRVVVSPEVDADSLVAGQEVMLNESMAIVAACAFEQLGEIVMFKEVLPPGDRALVLGTPTRSAW